MAALLAAVFIAAALAACAADQDDPSFWPEPGAALPPQDGASVWVVGAPDLVFRSLDGGATWQETHRSDTDIFTGDLWAIAFGDATHGWAVRRGVGSERTTVLATSDAGATWSWQYPRPQAGALLAVAASGAERAWAVGRRPGDSFEAPGLVISTVDGGDTWTRQRLDTDLQPFDVAFTDARHGWILARDREGMERYVVLATVDGGSRWRITFQTTTVKLTGLAASGSRSCWAIGYVEHPRSAQIIATRDGGEHWEVQYAGSGDALLDVDFPDPQHGWAVGGQGCIVSTRDGGRTWTARHVDKRFELRYVSFANEKRGFALIYVKALLGTVDGGATWTVVRPSDEKDVLLGLDCVPSGAATGQ